MPVSVFWLITLLCVVCALFFVLPAIGPRKNLFALIAAFAVPMLAYSTYHKLGSGAQLTEFYSPKQIEQRSNNQQMRPMYAKLQREVVKSQLNILGDKANIDLIISFAIVYAKTNGGFLQEDIRLLLENVLRQQPRQEMALRLLAQHNDLKANRPS